MSETVDLETDYYRLHDENEQLRALLARSLPLLVAMNRAIDVEFAHMTPGDTESEIADIREHAKTLGVEVKE